MVLSQYAHFEKNAAVSDSTTGSSSPPTSPVRLRLLRRYLRDHLVFGRAIAWPST